MTENKPGKFPPRFWVEDWNTEFPNVWRYEPKHFKCEEFMPYLSLKEAQAMVRAAREDAMNSCAAIIEKKDRQISELEQKLETSRQRELCRHGYPGTCLSCKQDITRAKSAGEK